MIQSVLESFQDPHSRHAILVHFPIVLGALGIIPAIALAVRKFRSPIASAICITWFAATMIALGLASGAGEEAAERVERGQPPLSQIEHDALEAHESLGEGAWLWALPPLALAILTIVPRKEVQIAAGVLLIIASATLAGFVFATGHTGGVLVYRHGLGVPPREASPAPATSSPTINPATGTRDDD